MRRSMRERVEDQAGPEKGAHYSAPMSAGPLPLLMAGLAFAAMLFPARGFPARAANRPESDAKKTETQLQAVKSEIERITRQVSGEQVERDRLTRELRAAEISVGKARESLESVRHDRA